MRSWKITSISKFIGLAPTVLGYCDYNLCASVLLFCKCDNQYSFFTDFSSKYFSPIWVVNVSLPDCVEIERREVVCERWSGPPLAFQKEGGTKKNFPCRLGTIFQNPVHIVVKLKYLWQQPLPPKSGPWRWCWNKKIRNCKSFAHSYHKTRLKR